MSPTLKLLTIFNLNDDVFIIFLLMFSSLLVASINIMYYRYYLKHKTSRYKKIAKRKFLQIFCVSLLVMIPILVIWLNIIISANTLYKEVKNNNITTETLFSVYHITEINGTNEFKSTVIYDKSGNKKSEEPAVLYEVVLSKDEKNKIVGLKGSVVINVTKVNDNSFNVLLPDDQVVTVKEKDAKEIFNTLNKIKEKEREE